MPGYEPATGLAALTQQSKAWNTHFRRLSPPSERLYLFIICPCGCLLLEGSSCLLVKVLSIPQDLSLKPRGTMPKHMRLWDWELRTVPRSREEAAPPLDTSSPPSQGSELQWKRAPPRNTLSPMSAQPAMFSRQYLIKVSQTFPWPECGAPGICIQKASFRPLHCRRSETSIWGEKIYVPLFGWNCLGSSRGAARLLF